jgi:hypothetical protein
MIMDNTTYQQVIGEIGTIITIVSPLLVAFIGAYKLKVHEFIEAKINAIKDDNLKKVAQNVLDRVENLTTTTITMLDATLKPQIIENIKSGAMTKDNLLRLKTDAIDIIKKQLTTDGVNDLQNSVGDVNTYLDTLIEAKLADLKVDSTSSVSKTIVPEVSQDVIDNTELKNQLAQLQAEKDELLKQVEVVNLDKTNVEQANSQLVNKVNDLTTQNSQLLADKQAIQSKLDAINATLSQVVQPQPVADNNVQSQADVNGVTTNTVQ